MLINVPDGELPQQAFLSQSLRDLYPILLGSNHLCKKNLRGLKAIRLIDHKGPRGIGRGTITYCLCYSNGSIQACTNPLASSTWRRESLKLIHH
nr:hypothetical protein CFP56_77324 [Quercus suber]